MQGLLIIYSCLNINIVTSCKEQGPSWETCSGWFRQEITANNGEWYMLSFG